MNQFDVTLLPKLEYNGEGNGYDTSQYDQFEASHERECPVEAATSLLRTGMYCIQNEYLFLLGVLSINFTNSSKTNTILGLILKNLKLHFFPKNK